jgi:hypothetical protein
MDDSQLRREKSLGQMTVKFVHMFLRDQMTPISLEKAAESLQTPEDECDPRRAKTRFRRLYDIANILSALDLIRKETMVKSTGSRFPAFVWVKKVAFSGGNAAASGGAAAAATSIESEAKKRRVSSTTEGNSGLRRTQSARAAAPGSEGSRVPLGRMDVNARITLGPAASGESCAIHRDDARTVLEVATKSMVVASADDVSDVGETKSGLTAQEEMVAHVLGRFRAVAGALLDQDIRSRA